MFSFCSQDGRISRPVLLFSTDCFIVTEACAINEKDY
jgi:hypothetical protein